MSVVPHSTSSLPQQQRLSGRALRAQRSVSFGPCMRLLFENHETVRAHVAEMLRIEGPGAGAAAVREETERCAHLLPDGRSWKATLFIGLADAAERARELPRLNEAVHEFVLEWPGHAPVVGSANDDLPDRHRTRPSAVHFIRFAFDAPQRAALWTTPPPTLTLRCAHPAYPFAAQLDPLLVARLRADIVTAAQAATLG